MSVLQRNDGFKTQLFAVEVGAKGLVGSSVYNLLKRLDLTCTARSRSLKRLAEAAEKGSHWIWLKRDDVDWRPDLYISSINFVGLIDKSGRETPG